MASYATSRSILSCGSILLACFGCTPKKAASKLVKFFTLPLLFGSPYSPENDIYFKAVEIKQLKNTEIHKQTKKCKVYKYKKKLLNLINGLENNKTR